MNHAIISSYLANSDPTLTHWLFPSEVAKELSDLAAVLLYDINGRIENRDKPLVRNGHSWTYDSIRVFAETHKFASEAGIRKALLELEKHGYIHIEKSGKYNRASFDRKWWYTLTPTGRTACKRRRIRYFPEVADELGLPKSVILQNIRYLRLSESPDAYATIDPVILDAPYSAKTIQRHLDELVSLKILERDPTEKKQYRPTSKSAPAPAKRTVPPDVAPVPKKRPQPGVEPVNWSIDGELGTKNTPVTVNPSDLLPPLSPGEIGLLVGHSGTGKTSYSSFYAVQNAVVGKKVLYLSLEEPAKSISDRMMASEFDVSYSDLRNGVPEMVAKVNERLTSDDPRVLKLRENLRVKQFSKFQPSPHEISEAIGQYVKNGFTPDVVILDQLERIEAPPTTSVQENASSDDAPASMTALGPAFSIRECFKDHDFPIWVLHQVLGDATLKFDIAEIAGGEDVVACFDRVIGISRDGKSTDALRIFSLDKDQPFERLIIPDFPHMRFVPRQV